MALSLGEAYKLNNGEVYKNAIIELFARGSDILNVLPFENITGNSFKYNREETLPGVAFRGINEAYTESTGILNPQTETLSICGGEIDIDRFLLKTMGANQRGTQVMLKVKAMALNWNKIFVKGDNATEPREFDGIQVRCTGDQLISAGSTANGTPLSLTKMDELKDAVEDPQYWLMNKTMKRRLAQAARTTSVGGYITFELGAFGRRVQKYDDMPILIADKDATNADILPFTEAASSGTSTATSIYCLSLGEGKLIGFQNGSMDVKDLGEVDDKPVERTRIEWYSGIACFHGKAIARLRHISDAAVTA